MKQLAAFAAFLVSQISAAERSLDLEDETAQINYSVGYQVGGDFERLGVEIRPDALLRGIEEAFAGTDSALEPGEMRTITIELGRRLAEQKRELGQRLGKDQAP